MSEEQFPSNHKTQTRGAAASIIPTATRETLPLPVTGVILCGGRSRRMGRPKAFLPFGGQTIIEHLISSVQDLFDELFLVTNEPDAFSHLTVNVVRDILPYRGPLGGILSGLLVSANEHAFVMACDMPLVDQKLIRNMAARRHGHDVVVLAHNSGVEPLLGVYSKSCIRPIEESLFAGNLKMQDFLVGLKAGVYTYEAEPDCGDSLPPYFNVNTPQDYSEVLTRGRPRMSPTARRRLSPIG